MVRISLALASCFALFGPVAGAFAQNAHRTGQSPAEVRAYWTHERMKNAKPIDKAKPGGGGGGTSATSVEVNPITGVLTAHGKVFFSDNGVNYVCSGTALTGDVVWTAGHCVNEGPGAYYTNFMFVPAYRDNTRPYGTFTGVTLMTTDGWRTAGEFGVDVGAVVPSRNESGQTLAQAVTERNIVFNSIRNQAYAAYGYPAAGRFNGQRLRVCNTAWSRDDTSTNPDTMAIPCDMTGGSSGGGWVTAGGAVASVVSYGYQSLKNVLFGPHLESEAQSLYNAAVKAPHP